MIGQRLRTSTTTTKTTDAWGTSQVRIEIANPELQKPGHFQLDVVLAHFGFSFVVPSQRSNFFLNVIGLKDTSVMVSTNQQNAIRYRTRREHENANEQISLTSASCCWCLAYKPIEQRSHCKHYQ